MQIDKSTSVNKLCQWSELLYNFLCLKFFEGFLGEAFFQESSPKRVPYKSQFVYKFSNIFSAMPHIVTASFGEQVESFFAFGVPHTSKSRGPIH